ncbi:MAG: response regulator [Coleofasciculus sp. A1-SPW-01]|uniref:response regulator n=1 Tax=Coleofasciculus sp. A1-SPW-01 TaxID=3070819 RepID=UPI0033034ECF
MAFPLFSGQQSITRRTLVNVALRIAGVIVVLTTWSYFHTLSFFESEALERVKKYVYERGERESILFSIAVDNHTLLKQELIKNLKEPNYNSYTKFNQLFVEWSDGVIRNRPKDQPPEKFDTLEQAGVYIDENLVIDAEVRQRVLTFYNLTTTYGSVWHHRFINTYITSPDNIIAIYWPGTPWVQRASTELNLQNEKKAYGAKTQTNAESNTVWTGLYYDPQAQDWIVSVKTPVNLDGEHIATIGHDLTLNQLMDRMIQDQTEGGYNILFSGDGHLIVHPDKIDEIKQKKGQFNILESDDPHLQRIFQLVKDITPNQIIIENTKDNEYLAVARIDEPDWYLVTVFPQSILAKPARDTAGFILGLGLVALVLELLVLYFVLRRQVTNPLIELMGATERIAAGDLNIQLDDTRKDELGRLANLFNSMAVKVYVREQFLKQAESEAKRLQKTEADTRQHVESINQILEGRVEERTAHLTAIINNLVDGLLVTDTQGKISQFNPAFLRMLGLGELDITDKKGQDILNSELVELVTQTQNHHREVFTAEIDLAGGRIGKAVATAIDKVALADGAVEEFLGSVILIRDITVEKEVDQMKTDFISTVSHELRTPLTSVLGFTKIIKKKLEDVIFPQVQTDNKKIQRTVRQVKDNVTIIVSEGERLTALINDVLDIAKMEAGKVDWNMQPLLVHEIIERAIAATSSLFETKHIQFIKKVETELPEISGDKDRLIQVLINLISNAVKFTQKGTITCRATQRHSEIIISVIDTGMGIAPADQPQVFEKFKQVGDTLTDKPKGTGLGLPICKQIVEHHGGRIWVESEFKKGSTFSFTLPIHTNLPVQVNMMDMDTLVKQLQVTVTPDKSSTKKTSNRTVLVVDNEALIRQLLRQELESRGYQVREAKDGLEAIALVKQERPDLITLDVMMPEMNGFDVAAVLKNDPSTMDIPIIILSIIEDHERGYRLGIDKYITKPFESEQLLQEIDSLIAQGSSKKKILVVDENISTVKTLADVLTTRGYNVIEVFDGEDFKEKAISVKPDMIIVNSELSERYNIVKTLRFEKGLENVFFLLLANEKADGNHQSKKVAE